jgi:hypothetical protein
LQIPIDLVALAAQVSSNTSASIWPEIGYEKADFHK